MCGHRCKHNPSATLGRTAENAGQPYQLHKLPLVKGVNTALASRLVHHVGVVTCDNIAQHFFSDLTLHRRLQKSWCVLVCLALQAQHNGHRACKGRCNACSLCTHELGLQLTL